MIEILPTSGLVDGKMPIGSECRFRIVTAVAAIEIQVHLRHLLVFHPKNLRGWSTSREIAVFPEAPGNYSLLVEWRTPAGENGCVELAFEVEPGTSFQPTLVESGTLGEFWAPNGHEANGIAGYENSLLGQLELLIAPGSVAYDIGANIGLAAVPLAKAVGPSGQVFCFEPNPLCVAYLQANLERHGCNQCRILPLAVTGGEQQVAFTVNFANSLLGLSLHSGFYGSKIGQEILVAGDRLDLLQQRFRLPPPDVIKIDVEGAEVAILPGLRPVLEASRPLLLLELHHFTLAAALLPELSALGYWFQDCVTGEKHEGPESLIANFGAVRQLFCFPNPADA